MRATCSTSHLLELLALVCVVSLAFVMVTPLGGHRRGGRRTRGKKQRVLSGRRCRGKRNRGRVLRKKEDFADGDCLLL